MLSTNPDGTQNIKTCSLPHYRLAIYNFVPTDVGFDWMADYDTEKLMLDWDLYLFIYTGTGLKYYVSPNYLTFYQTMADYGYNFTDYSGRHIEIEALKDTGDTTWAPGTRTSAGREPYGPVLRPASPMAMPLPGCMATMNSS